MTRFRPMFLLLTSVAISAINLSASAQSDLNISAGDQHIDPDLHIYISQRSEPAELLLEREVRPGNPISAVARLFQGNDDLKSARISDVYGVMCGKHPRKFREYFENRFRQLNWLEDDAASIEVEVGYTFLAPQCIADFRGTSSSARTEIDGAEFVTETPGATFRIPDEDLARALKDASRSGSSQGTELVALEEAAKAKLDIHSILSATSLSVSATEEAASASIPEVVGISSERTGIKLLSVSNSSATFNASRANALTDYQSSCRHHVPPDVDSERSGLFLKTYQQTLNELNRAPEQVHVGIMDSGFPPRLSPYPGQPNNALHSLIWKNMGEIGAYFSRYPDRAPIGFTPVGNCKVGSNEDCDLDTAKNRFVAAFNALMNGSDTVYLEDFHGTNVPALREHSHTANLVSTNGWHGLIVADQITTGGILDRADAQQMWRSTQSGSILKIVPVSIVYPASGKPLRPERWREGLTYLIARDSNIISISSGYTCRSGINKKWLGRLISADNYSDDLLFVFASGNAGKFTGLRTCATKQELDPDLEQNPIYPAGSPLIENKIVVGGFDPTTGDIAKYSTYSNGTVDIVADGCASSNLPIDMQYQDVGTSFSAPKITFVASALRSLGLKKPQDIRARIILSGKHSQKLAQRTRFGMSLSAVDAIDFFHDVLYINCEGQRLCENRLRVRKTNISDLINSNSKCRNSDLAYRFLPFRRDGNSVSVEYFTYDFNSDSIGVSIPSRPEKCVLNGDPVLEFENADSGLVQSISLSRIDGILRRHREFH